MDSLNLEKKLGLKGKTIKIDENMGLTVLNEGINKLLSRLEIDVHIDHITTGTPSKHTLRSIIAKLYGVPEDVVVVKKIESEYGIGVSRAHIHVYADGNEMRKIEPDYILKRNGLAK